MPHIVYKSNEELIVPSKFEDVEFNFCAKAHKFGNEERYDEYKIAVSYEGKEFLLTKKTKNENEMIKADKITRVTPVSLIKDALNAYSKSTNAVEVFSNTKDLPLKAEVKKEYLKDMDYFLNGFDTDKEIYIEIGFGSGRHLIHQAKQNPDVQLIGLEIHTPSIEQVLKQLKIQEISNILAVNYDARLFMEFIKSNRVSKIFVHFPVPWDKKPHRRIYSNDFINEALRVLKKDGTLELRTDSRKYFDYCTSLLTTLPTGKITIDINKELEVSSKYEDRWKLQGKNIYDVVLTNYALDKEIALDYKFDFEAPIDLDSIKDTINTKPQVFETFFIHLENIYLLENDSGLIQITFGSFNRPLSKYIYVKNKKARYFQDSPLPTSANIASHKKLLEILA